MRSFAYINPDFVQDTYVPVSIEENPCYQPSVYDSVMYDQLPDGDLVQREITHSNRSSSVIPSIIVD